MEKRSNTVIAVNSFGLAVSKQDNDRLGDTFIQPNESAHVLNLSSLPSTPAKKVGSPSTHLWIMELMLKREP